MANRPKVVVVGTGFAGYHCLRTLEHLLGPDDADLVAVNPTDYMLYLPLLPEVAAGILDPRRIAVPLRTKLPRTRLVLGSVSDVDVSGQRCTVVDIEGRESVLEWDRLVITSGSVTRLLSIPGVAEYAKGFRSIAEAVFLRDHILRQLELAEQSTDPVERAARTTFVVVGAGYTGTELAAQGQLLTREALRRYKGLSEKDVRWLLVDMAPRVLPGLSKRLSGPALRVLRRRGVDVRLETSVKEVTATCVKLTDDTEIPTRTVAWCVGVRPDPLVESTQLEAVHGRIAVDRKLRTAANQNVFAAGDVAGVPDATRPGEITPMTAQHAQRQGKVAGVNVAASLGHGMMHQYKHHDLGFLVDLAGPSAVADPLHIPISGLPAKAITRGYHLLALPGNRARVLADWAIDLVSTRQFVQLGLVHGTSMEDADQPPM